MFLETMQYNFVTCPSIKTIICSVYANKDKKWHICNLTHWDLNRSWKLETENADDDIVLKSCDKMFTHLYVNLSALQQRAVHSAQWFVTQNFWKYSCNAKSAEQI